MPLLEIDVKDKVVGAADGVGGVNVSRVLDAGNVPNEFWAALLKVAVLAVCWVNNCAAVGAPVGHVLLIPHP